MNGGEATRRRRSHDNDNMADVELTFIPYRTYFLSNLSLKPNVVPTIQCAISDAALVFLKESV